MFEGYDDAKTALMESILQSIQEEKTWFEGSSEKIKGLIKRVDWIRVGSTAIRKGVPLSLSLMSGNPLPMMFGGYSKKGFDTEEEVTEKMDGLQQLKNDYLKAPEDDNIIENIRKFREDFSDLISESKVDNLIIIIDDLDRCNPERIIETLEAIKLFLSVEKTTFIIAMDEKIITYSIKRKYPQLDDVDIDVSTDYIEKIVQLPIRIAELAETDIKNYMLLLISEMYLKEKILNDLLDNLKEKGVFVKGEIISGREIIELVNELSNEEEVYKEGYNKSDFEEQIHIFNTIGNVIATTLQGNPRQAKRFLNTFYIRKRLAEIQRIDLNLSILAKLMVLEYTNKKLFRELYTWHVEHNGYPKPLADIERKVLDKESAEEKEADLSKDKRNKSWYDERIKRWIGVEPDNLSEKDLSQYFYIARDGITDKKLAINNLNQYERKIVNTICNSSLTEIIKRKKIEELKDMDEITRNEIVKGIISKFSQDKSTQLWTLIEVYKILANHREKIFKELKSFTKKEISPNEIILFSELDKGHLQELKDYYIERKNVSSELWEIAGGK
jgi:hypothetical protein